MTAGNKGIAFRPNKSKLQLQEPMRATPWENVRAARSQCAEETSTRYNLRTVLIPNLPRRGAAAGTKNGEDAVGVAVADEN